MRKLLLKTKITWKKAFFGKTDRNSLPSKMLRKKVALELGDYIKKGKNIIFIDECGFNQNLVPKYGWYFSKKKYRIPQLPKSRNLSAIVAISLDGIVGL